MLLSMLLLAIDGYIDGIVYMAIPKVNALMQPEIVSLLRLLEVPSADLGGLAQGSCSATSFLV